MSPSVGVLLCGCATNGVLSPRGPIADANRTIMLNALAVMLAIVAPTLLAAAGFAWWFRAGNTRARYDPKFTYSGRIEAVVWGIPLLTVVFLGGLIWTGSHQVDPYRRLPSAAEPLEVQVVSLDWKWLFIYPDEGIASVNRLVLPARRPIHFTLTSASVMNVFFVPQLGSQIYTMNGMATQLSLQADELGIYRGQSSQFSGDGFSQMTFPVVAVQPAEFDRWVGEVRRQGPVLDLAAYGQLAQPTRGGPQKTFAAVQPRLFAAILRQAHPTPAGPQHGSADALEKTS